MKAALAPSPFRMATTLIGDLLWAAAILAAIPLVILALGIPIALCLRFLLWIVGLL